MVDPDVGHVLPEPAVPENLVLSVEVPGQFQNRPIEVRTPAQAVGRGVKVQFAAAVLHVFEPLGFGRTRVEEDRAHLTAGRHQVGGRMTVELDQAELRLLPMSSVPRGCVAQPAQITVPER